MPPLLAGLPWLAVAAAVGALVHGAGRGLDLTDESGYLLAARPWAGTSSFTSVFGWYLGPWLRLLGDDVTWLRVSGVLLLVAAGALAGLAAGRAVGALGAGPRADGEAGHVGARAAMPGLLVPAVAVAATTFYASLLRTPGYGWFAAAGLLLVTAGVLRLGVERPDAPVLPVALPLGAGLALTAAGKLTTAAVAALVVVAVGAGRRAWRRLAATGGVLAVLAGVHLAFVAGAGDTLAALDRSRQVAGVVDPAHYTLRGLPSAAGRGVLDVVTAGGSWVALLALLPAVVLLPRPAALRTPAAAVLATLPGLVGPAALLAATPRPGPQQGAAVVVVAAGTATVLVLATAARPGGGTLVRASRRALPAVLAADVLALAYPLGTNNSALWAVAGAAGVLVAGAGVALAAASAGRARTVLVAALTVVAAVAALLPLATVRAAQPYRTLPLAQQTVALAPVPGTPPLLVDPATAQWAATLRAGAAGAGWRPGTPLLDLSWHPATVLVLDGRAPSALLPAFPRLPSFGASARLVVRLEAATSEGRARWRDAWLVVPGRARPGGPSPAVQRAVDGAVQETGRRFPADYERVVAVTSPFDRNVQELWRPAATS